MNVIHYRKMYRLVAFYVFFSLGGMLQAQVLDTTIVEGLEKPGFIESDLNNSLSK